MTHWRRRLAGGLAAWAVAALVVLLESWPPPETTRGWALLFLAGPPAYFALEWIGSRLFGPEVGARISPARFSWVRIAYGVLVLLVLLAPFVWWGLSRAR